MSEDIAMAPAFAGIVLGVFSLYGLWVNNVEFLIFILAMLTVLGILTHGINRRYA